MENQSVYKITAILYANRYTGYIETIFDHMWMALSLLNNRVETMNNERRGR